MNHIEINKKLNLPLKKIYTKALNNSFYRRNFSVIYDNIIIIFIITYFVYLFITYIIDLSPLILMISRYNYFNFVTKYENNLYKNENFEISIENDKIK